MSTNRRTALARAASTRTWPVGMCDNFCANMYGFKASGYVDAVAHWKALPAAVRHSGDTVVPAGMLAYWSGGHGHVAISAGNGDVWSTDIAGPGTVARVPLARVAADWGKPYLGWSEPVFQGVAWSEDMVEGIDIAGYQPVNFATAGKSFVCIKITEGTSYVNPNWVGQRATARAAQLVPGFYHFARPGSMMAQADYFLSKISLQAGDWLAFDWEDTGVSGAQKDQWIKYVQQQRPGHKVLLYCNRDFWLNRDTSGFAGDGLWIADPSAPKGQPRVTAPWLIHQYGESSGYDLDTAQFSSRAAMLDWAGGTADMAITQADADLVNKTIRDAPIDDPTTSDNSTSSFAGVVWNAGRNAAQANDKAGQALTQIATLRTSLDALSAKVPADGFAAVYTKLASLQASVTDPSGLIDQIRTELESFELVLQQKTPGA
jgi:Glycosyl hydrolases family 25